ncbi:citrate synthase 2 [Thermobispora bispora]|jgi:citrate synthase|uniref:Citrate synthase n=1 Tax=Thermobispora bispora (strain ATCC 19993 / DSM 43833 / CBS 139.67 / JCM 10125 / KCTC 9307 / NBRC 14880 / R51) TaxID=469371 RepID=D6Y5P2_THEBD|nr:citrate/2-methylcitrate synthase [Thermobispora bispora]MBO2472729.1 citrate synthase [Actinomycetales bacterium]MDI9579830.1 citrate/2-methylcitrate synthase [Thermobispora sp.]ADG87388.1 2-methylcitrate synthase/citrate synthase II [Thermobispora bispora DSM 43833]MBX6168727.1 citrate synthase [Thermobispora bispora]QSI47332.1 citrate synthase [Thermobispora bispora]
MADNPTKGLADVVAASTALSDIDGKAGRLSYRGYDIHDLAGRTSFEEIAYLLQRGALPNRAQLDAYTAELAEGRSLGPLAEACLGAIAERQEPMEALRSLVSLTGADDPDKNSNAPEANLRKAARLTAQQPILVARYHAARTGATLPEIDPEAGIAEAFLHQITGRRPSQREIEIFDTCLVLHADHTMNASTFAARVCAATLSDMHSAIVAALGTLKGPLHGGANEQVMRTLEAMDPRGVARAVREKLARGEKIMGFGHRVYKTEDPRATHLRRMSQELAEASGDDTYFRMSREMEEVVFAEKGLYPNVDFYAATVYHYLGIPTDLFTPVFSISRMAGWTAHVIEQHADNRLIRPDSEYVGERDKKWLPIDER